MYTEGISAILIMCFIICALLAFTQYRVINRIERIEAELHDINNRLDEEDFK